MPPIGETLRDARLRRSLEIADVEARTKIRAKYLRALEHEEWSALPGPTYVRTFLRTYAEVLGVDGHLLVDEYRSLHDVEDPELASLAGPPAVERRQRGGSRGSRRIRPPGPGMVFGLLVVALVGLLLVLGLVSDPDDEREASNPPTVTRSEGKRAGPPKRRARPALAKRVTLRIAPQVPTYACLDSGPGTEIVYEGTLASARSFRNPRRLRVNLGTRQVQVSANGRRVPIKPGADPVGVTADRRGGRLLAAQTTRPCG